MRFFHTLFASFRPLLRLHRVTSDAADVLMFQPGRVKPPVLETDTWRAAWGLFGLATALALHADHVPLWLAGIIAGAAWWLLRSWGKASDNEARRAYLAMSGGIFVQMLSALAPRLEWLFAIWFVIAFVVALNQHKPELP